MSSTNRRILQLLSKRDMTTMEVFKELSQNGPAYRQSVHKALQKMKDAGLVSKYYDDEAKVFRYHLHKERIEVDFKRMTTE